MFCRDDPEGEFVCNKSCLCSVGMIQSGSLSATGVVYVLQGCSRGGSCLLQELFMFCRDVLEGELSATGVAYVLQGGSRGGVCLLQELFNVYVL